MNKIVLDSKQVILNKSDKYFLKYDNNINDVEIVVKNSVDAILYVFCSDRIISNSIRYYLHDNAKLVVNKFYNNLEVNENIVVNLNGENSSIIYNFSDIIVGLESYDILINHNNKNVYSKFNNKVVAFDGAGANFNINSSVDKGNSNVIMDQKTKIINLGKNRSVVRPILSVGEYDVKATHGSVIGKFRDDDIFYCMSRGISYENTMNLLVKGFLSFNNFEDNEFFNNVNSIIDMYWR